MKRYLAGQTKLFYSNQTFTPNPIADLMFQPSNMMLFWVHEEKIEKKLVMAKENSKAIFRNRDKTFREKNTTQHYQLNICIL